MPVPVELSDNFTGTDGAAWSGIWTTRNVQGSSATPIIVGNAGRMVTDPANVNDCRIIAHTSPVMANFDMTVRFRATDTTTLGAYIEICYRVSGDLTSGNPGPGYALIIQPSGGTIAIWTLPGYSDYVAVLHDQPIDNTSAWYYRIRCKNNRHQVKWWLAGTDEPPGWKFDVLDSLFASGRVLLGTYNRFIYGPPAVWMQAIVDWDEFHQLEILPPDPGFRVGAEPVTAIKIGATDVITAWHNGVEVPVTWP